jgi:AmmeMemoRadiSam system protein B
VISPHAGYRYSGAVAGAAYRQVIVPEVVVLLGIGHRPTVRPNVIGLTGHWQTPLGAAPIDAGLAEAIHAATDLLAPDQGEQRDEHSLELQLPFLQHRNPDVRIVPIQVRDATPERCRIIGEAIADVITRWPTPALLVASTDLHHQQSAPGLDPPTIVPQMDQVAIDRILAFDPEGLYADVRSRGVTMCGLLPTTMALHAAKRLGATSVQEVEHATSYEISGSSSYVVGYLSAVVR